MRKLDILNCEGPVILAKKEKGDNRISLKFDDNKDTVSVNKKTFERFINGEITIISPNKNEEFNYLNFGSGFGKPSAEEIIDFLNY